MKTPIAAVINSASAQRPDGQHREGLGATVRALQGEREQQQRRLRLLQVIRSSLSEFESWPSLHQPHDRLTAGRPGKQYLCKFKQQGPCARLCPGKWR